MVEHQRNILAVLGIDLWVPQADAQTRPYISSLYRDQAAPEVQGSADFNHQDLHHQQFNHTSPDQDLLNQTGIVNNKRDRPADPQSNRLTEKSIHPLSPPAIDALSVEVARSLDAEHVQKLEPFEIQAWIYAHCVVLVDSTALTGEQLTLWRNIQMAKAGQFSSLKWPFALPTLQDGRGVHAYVQGFIDALSMDKKVLSLGIIQSVRSNEIIKIASLQEMLEQPQLKSQLWQWISTPA